MLAVCVRIILFSVCLVGGSLAVAAGPDINPFPAARIDTSPRLQSAAKRNLRLAGDATTLAETTEASGDSTEAYDLANGFSDGVTPAGMYSPAEDFEEVYLPEEESSQHFLHEAEQGYADPAAWDDQDYWQQEPPAPVASSSTWFNRGRWYAKQDFVYMTRYSTDFTRIAADYTLLRPVLDIPYVAMNTPRGLGGEPGARITLGRFLCRDRKNRDHTLEFSFLGLFDFQQADSLTARAPGSIFSLIDPYRTTFAQTPVFNSSNAQAFAYNSSFDSYEMNYVVSQRLGRDQLELQPNGEWIRTLKPGHVSAASVGVRVISIGEGFDLTSEGENAGEIGSYEVNTKNDLLGVHFGYEFTYQRPKWRLGMRTRIGSFINYADQNSFVTITDPADPIADRIESASSHDVSFVFDFSLAASYHIRPNISLRAGYDFLFVNQIALAPEQLTFNPGPTPTIVNGGQLLYNGLSLGVEFVW
jgi:hypothetical protein